MTTTQKTFAMYGACHRCGGFARAFARHTHVAAGKCLACNGGLRENIVRPMSRLSDYRHPTSRATDIAIIAAVLEDISSASDEPLFNLPTRRADDVARIVAATLSVADADVRARAYAAVTTRIRQSRDAQTAVTELRAIDCAIAEATGLAVADVAAWASGATKSAAA